MATHRLGLQLPCSRLNRKLLLPFRHLAQQPGGVRRAPAPIRFKEGDASPTAKTTPPAGAQIPAPVGTEHAAAGVPLVERVDIPPKQHGSSTASPINQGTDPGTLPSDHPAGTTGGDVTARPPPVAVDVPSDMRLPPTVAIPANVVRLPPILGDLSQLVGAGLLALAVTSVALPNMVLPFLLPTAAGHPQSWFLSAVWGAALMPLAAAILTVKGVIDSDMAGTPAADQVMKSIMVGTFIILLVIVQAVSLRHPPFNVVVGGLVGASLAMTSWLMAVAHPWMLPLPKLSTLLSSALSVFKNLPTRWPAWVWTIISLGQIGAGIWWIRSSSAHIPPLLLGRLAAPSTGVQSLAVFVARSGGAALLTSGLLSGLLAAVADKQLLTSPVALRISSAIGTSSLLIPLAVGMSFAVGACAPTPELLTILFGQLAVSTWAIVATLRPTEVQGQRAVVIGPDGQQTTMAAPNWPHVAAAMMTTKQFWQALAKPREEY